MSGVPGSGCDVLLQSQGRGACQGFVDVGVHRPLRVLVREGSEGAAMRERELVGALAEVLRQMGREANGSAPPCRGRLRSPCVAAGEPGTFNLLAWIASTQPPGPEAEQVAKKWVGRANAGAVAIVPEGVDPDLVLPPALRRFHVIRFRGRPWDTALEVLAAGRAEDSERRVFISYSHADGVDEAHAVLHALAEARFSVFLDAFGLAPGSDFEERLRHQLMDKAFLVLIETPRAIASEWVGRELSFARQHRLGIVSVHPEASEATLPQVFPAQRWSLPAGALERRAGSAALKPGAADDLREFVTLRHEMTILRRRYELERGLRAALAAVGVSGRSVRRTVGGLEVDTARRRWSVSLRPRPASLLDMHAAARQAPPRRPVMVSATPQGQPEREALAWLAESSGVAHCDEGLLLPLARGIAKGRVR
jgi:TIR domain-containing protein